MRHQQLYYYPVIPYARARSACQPGLYLALDGEGGKILATVKDVSPMMMYDGRRAYHLTVEMLQSKVAATYEVAFPTPEEEHSGWTGGTRQLTPAAKK